MFTVVARAHIAPVTKASAKHTKAHAKAAAKPAIAKAFDRVKLPALTLAMQAASMVPAAHAEAGKLFDFDLTLPIIATEFLLLMTILDKTVFGPVGKALDDRDELIRSQLAAVGDNSTEVDNLIAQKEQIIADARSEVAAEIAAMKKKMDADVAAAADKAKAEVDQQIATAMASLEEARKSSQSQVDAQATAIADQIIQKVVSV
ncbi:ATPase, F0 complex, subunit B/B',bacterial/chloroplast [Ostreococcus tauri]|uniref:ATP synthase B/B' CF(0)-domain-containing protein n=1 Tax=Ostreococcus tauri TaxID=70448 RepID=A0A090N2N0_OSTTA|nr:ATPase, F0 complex, subunit B/B',bacterial/chloroplast [Ostreococcus tauri]OUS42879.1 ATP synthase B/B' CF(0)-domain-containing protein [Ostreococcus tauri]CEF96523.1 ATPase, F0 complex, subunit B/B',bacterial/chloroplast [Ostreococcus tauri]|eukprot:XP_022838141.1 ATPase, F0 complex, subunit B/B',bacterial/chloroplast [Ostreococcus tauri]